MKSWSAACIFICIISLNIQAGTLTAFQTLETSGARAITPFKLDGHQYLAAAQLAKDIANTPANMNGGDSDVDVLIYQLRGEKFRIYQTIPGHGNEGATFFRLNNQAYLAIPSVRSGSKAPYNLNTYSMVYRWDGKYFIPFQQFYARAAKQWSYFSIGERHFLALATGVETPGKKLADNHSKIYEWNGKEFVLFQDIPSRWGYSFTAFKMDNHDYLGFADHLDGLTILNGMASNSKQCSILKGTARGRSNISEWRTGIISRLPTSINHQNYCSGTVNNSLTINILPSQAEEVLAGLL